MRYLAYSLFFFLVSAVCMADQVAVTEDEKKVILRNDKTWEYLEKAPEGAPPPAEKEAPTEEAATGALQPSVPPPEGPGARPGAQITTVLIVSAVFILAIGAILLYFLVIQPARRRKLVVQAYEIIESDLESEFPRAEEILHRAIVSGLKAKDISNAYFALAYVKARVKKYKEAAVDLLNADQKNSETIYLSLWLKVKLEEYKEAYELYAKHGDIVQDTLNAKELASIACLQLGREHWRNREIDAAIHYFDQVRKLGVHLDKLPETISTHQVTLGILALFDKHFDEAEEQFKGALEQARKENKSDVAADLGLLLCEWRRLEYPDIDTGLAEIVENLETKLPEVLNGAETRESHDRAAEQGKKKTELSEEKLLLRNAFLWFAVSRIFTWLHRKENSGLPDEEREILRQRLTKVTAVDPNMGDPHFIMGLIDYFFAYDTERENAVESIEKSGVKVPEAEIIVKREKKLLEYERDSLQRFFALAKKYLANRAIPTKLRKEMKVRLERFSRFKSIADEISIGEEDDEVAATLKDIQARGEILHKRMRNIMKTKLKEAGTEVKERYNELMAEMDETTQALSDTTRHLESTEQEIMVNSGEFLLSEEEKRERRAGKQNQG